MNSLQISNLDSKFYILQVKILHLDVKSWINLQCFSQYVTPFLKQQPSAKEIIFEIISSREKICRHWELNCEHFDPYVMTNYATVLPTIFSKKC